MILKLIAFLLQLPDLLIFHFYGLQILVYFDSKLFLKELEVALNAFKLDDFVLECL